MNRTVTLASKRSLARIALCEHVGAGMVLALMLLGLSGCGSDSADENSDPTAVSTPQAPIKLRVLVVDDAPLAAAIGRQTGEWNARAGGQLEIVQMTSSEMLESKSLDADAVIYSQRHLGHLASGELIVPVRPKLLERESYDAADVFELVQHRMLTWGDQPMAVPLGSPMLMLYYRADLLEKLDRAPPQTWEEYSQLAKLLGDRANLGELAPSADQPWHGCLEPLAKDWSAISLLARAAPYAKHRNRLAVLFDIDSMDPQVASPPFQKALEDMQAAGLGLVPTMNPAEVRQAIHSGECGMAITWPSSAEKIAEAAAPSLAIAPLPGARQVYDAGEASWQQVAGDQPSRVPLLGSQGRVGSVTSRSKNVPSVLRFLAWLSSEEISSQVSTASRATTMFRRSHLRNSSAWMEKGLDASASRDYASALQDALQTPEWLSVVRIPHTPAYLAALGSAVDQSLSGKAASQQALEDAANRWQQITDDAGRETQRQAYLRSLGL